MAGGYIDPLIAQQQGIPLNDPLLAPSLQKYQLAQALLRSGTDSSAAYPAQGVARVIETLAGLSTRGDATDEYQKAIMGRANQFGSAISGEPAPQQSAPPSSGGLFGGLFGSPQPSGSGSSPGLIGRLFGPSTMGSQPQGGASVDPLNPGHGTPAQIALNAAANAPQSGGAAAPSIGSLGITGTAAPTGAATPVAAMQAIAHRLLASGDPVLMQRGNDMLLQASEDQAKAFTTSAEKQAESGLYRDPNTGVVTAIPGYGESQAGIKGAETAATAGATKAAELQYAGRIADAQEGAKARYAGTIAQAQADAGPPSTIQTPGGPTLMSVPQQRAFAAGGLPAATLPASATGASAGGNLPAPDTARADKILANANSTIPQPQGGGALQDPKVRDAQIAEITGSTKRFADAQSRLQNLGQIQTLLANPAVITGAGGDQIQALRQAAIQGYNLIGKQPPAELVSGVASAEAIKAAANSLAIETSKDEGTGTPRISIFNAISQNKPGLESSPQGNLVRVLAMQQAAQREADFGNFAPTYYQQAGNFNKQDAEQAFAKLHPVSEYSGRIYPQSATDFARIPNGQTWIDSKGNPHTKNADIPAGVPANGPQP